MKPAITFSFCLGKIKKTEKNTYNVQNKNGFLSSKAFKRENYQKAVTELC